MVKDHIADNLLMSRLRGNNNQRNIAPALVSPQCASYRVLAGLALPWSSGCPVRVLPYRLYFTVVNLLLIRRIIKKSYVKKARQSNLYL